MQCIWTPSVSTARRGKGDQLGKPGSLRHLTYLLVVCLGAQVDQIGCDAGQESLAVRAAGTLVRLDKVLVQFVNGRLKVPSVDLGTRAERPESH